MNRDPLATRPDAALAELFEAFGDQLPVGFFVARERLLQVSEALADLVGRRAEALVGSAPDWLLPVERTRPEIPLGDTEVAASYRLSLGADPDARRRFEVRLFRVDLEGEPATVGLVMPSASGASRSEAKDKARWFEGLAETTTAAVFVYRDRFLYVNSAFERLSGYSWSELSSMSPVEVIHPDDQDRAEALVKARLAGKAQRHREEMMILTRRGEERWVEISTGSIEVDGQPAGLGAAFEITERKEAEQALKVSQERLALAQRAAKVLTWDWNLLTDELVVSDNVLEMWGITPEQIPGTTRELADRFLNETDTERIKEAVREAITGDGQYTVEHRIYPPDKPPLWFVEQGLVIRDETGWAVRIVGVSSNISERKQAEQALYESQERLRLMIEQIPAVLWATDFDLRFTSSVGGGLAGLGLATSEVEGQTLAEFFGTDDPEYPPLAAHRRVLEGASESFEMVWEERIFQAYVEPLRNDDGERVGCIGIALDVTRRRQAERALSRERELAATTLASIGDGVIRTDTEGIIEYINPVAETLVGCAAASALGAPLDEVYRVVDEGSRKALINPLERCLKENRSIILPGRRVLVARDGREIVIRDSAAPIRHGEGQPIGAVLVFKDVTVVREMELEMSYLATHDGLTGLLNRTEFERRLAQTLASAEKTRQPFALMQLDVARFKVVNDTCGHLAGDEMLKTVARLLTHHTDSEDVLSRLSSDEFALLLPGYSPAEARHKADEIRNAFRDLRFVWNDRSFEVGISIGLVPAGAGDAVSSLMIAADTACLMAKESGRNRVHEYRPDDAALAARHGEMHWTHRIYRALEEGNFRLFGQPIRRLKDDGTEEGLLCEVLIRLVDEAGRLVLPQTFIPAAERYRLIASIDRWVVERSLKLLRTGVTIAGAPISKLAINLSGESLSDDNFLDFTTRSIDGSGIDPTRLLFEITETAAIANLSGAMRFISELQDRGVRFVLDDFGSGLSSFSYLKNLPVDYLKIDREFVTESSEGGMPKTLVRSINQIGHDLGLQTIAEGIETQALFEVMQEIGLDYAQGYWIAEPGPLEEAGTKDPETA